MASELRAVPVEVAGPPVRRPIALLGFGDQGNLGIGYLTSVLRQHGYEVFFTDVRTDLGDLVQRVKSFDPLIVGFSLIFQYYIRDYRQIAQALRAAGVDCHFTIGGHYPTLCPEETLELLPEVDSAVRFEGELTIVDLADRLSRRQSWQDTAGIARRAGDGVALNELRPFVEDLDTLPHPERNGVVEEVVGFRAVPLLASRGCARRCSFCSIHMFYREGDGKVVRVRRPVQVVEEMEAVRRDLGTSIFLFQDDDFPLWGRRGRAWVLDLCDEIDAKGLGSSVIWKISCRADYIEPELFSRLQQSGLYLVYMGLESGSEEGLSVLNKKVTVETNLRAVDTLRSLGMMYQYGFMLFDPSSTFASVRENVQFLRMITADGRTAATFCRMLPYGGTPIRSQLAEEGRLKGDVVRPDYWFLDRRLNAYHQSLDAAVGCFIHGEGVSHQLNWAWHEVEVLRRLVPGLASTDEYSNALAALTRLSNGLLLDVVEESSASWERNASASLDAASLQQDADRIQSALLDERDNWVRQNVDSIVAAHDSVVRGPVLAPQVF